MWRNFNEKLLREDSASVFNEVAWSTTRNCGDCVLVDVAAAAAAGNAGLIAADGSAADGSAVDGYRSSDAAGSGRVAQSNRWPLQKCKMYKNRSVFLFQLVHATEHASNSNKTFLTTRTAKDRHTKDPRNISLKSKDWNSLKIAKFLEDIYARSWFALKPRPRATLFREDFEIFKSGGGKWPIGKFTYCIHRFRPW